MGCLSVRSFVSFLLLDLEPLDSVRQLHHHHQEKAERREERRNGGDGLADWSEPKNLEKNYGRHRRCRMWRTRRSISQSMSRAFASTL